MMLTNLHWGLHAWSIYAVCALVLAYFMFRRRLPGMISTPIRATLAASPSAHFLGLTAFRGESPTLRYPFLRPAHIPADAYPGQERAIETVTAQGVLASRVPPRTDLLGESGPGVVAGVFTRLPQQLPPDTALRLSQALDTPELVGPVLPASPGLRP